MRTTLLDDPYRVVLPKRHRLAGRRRISLKELADESWVETSCALGCCCQQVIDNAFLGAGFVPRRSVQASEYWPAQSFVSAGLGVALIPALALGAVHDGVVVRRLSTADETFRQVSVATRVAIVDQAAVRAMIDALKGAAVGHQKAIKPSTRSGPARSTPTSRPRLGEPPMMATA